ncbi:hypothetical protein ACFL2X_01995 [Candidatus Latescibacterota bacterium]
MRDEIKGKIQEIIGKIICPKDFACVESGFALLCKSKKIDNSYFIDCLEPDPAECCFAFSLKGFHLCKCPLRKYIKNNLKH